MDLQLPGIDGELARLRANPVRESPSSPSPHRPCRWTGNALSAVSTGSSEADQRTFPTGPRHLGTGDVPSRPGRHPRRPPRQPPADAGNPHPRLPGGRGRVGEQGLERLAEAAPTSSWSTCSCPASTGWIRRIHANPDTAYLPVVWSPRRPGREDPGHRRRGGRLHQQALDQGCSAGSAPLRVKRYDTVVAQATELASWNHGWRREWRRGGAVGTVRRRRFFSPQITRLL
jgi:hypothetical protein